LFIKIPNKEKDVIDRFLYGLIKNKLALYVEKMKKVVEIIHEYKFNS